jgi:hypothetical protein
MTNSSRQDQENFRLLQTANYQISRNPLPEQLQAMNDMDFGLARKDLEKEAKRYEWLEEEINYLEHYIIHVERAGDKRNRFANCLNHIRTETSADIKKYFHPHHVANSDRLKNGFNTAIKKIDSRSQRTESDVEE